MNFFRPPNHSFLTAALALGLLSLIPQPSSAQVSVLTQHNDNSRTGANLSEVTLNARNVSPATFGKLFTLPADGFVFAQPLFVPGVPIAGQGAHNVLYVATAHDSLYAYDADDGTLLWHTSLGVPVPSSVINTDNILVEVGIISTPVVDPSNNTIYVVSKSYENGSQIFRLHGLDIRTGSEQPHSPIVISAQVNGTGDGNDGLGHVPFITSKENQRTAITLSNGVLYLAFASYDDIDPYHGWVLAYSETNLQQLAAYNVTPNGGRGGVWMGGQGLTVDSSGFVYLISGNSTASEDRSAQDFGESFVKLALSGNLLSEVDYFKPRNYDVLNVLDADLGSGGCILIPGTNLLVGGGKQGYMYVVNSANMGQLNLSGDNIVQEWQAEVGLLGSPIYWNTSTPELFVWGHDDTLYAYRFNPSSNIFSTTASSRGTLQSASGTGCIGLSVSSNDSVANSGVVWASVPESSPDTATVPGTLYAFDASDVTRLLWSSKQNSSRDSFGNFAKFVPPTVANGRVYLATDSQQVCVYGPLATGTTPVITSINPNTIYAESQASTLSIHGAGFGSHSVLNLNGVSYPLDSATPSLATATLPASVVASIGNGVAKLFIDNGANFGGQSNIMPLTVADLPTPGLTTIAPAQVIAGTLGLTVTLTGSGFDPQSEVSLGGSVLPSSNVSFVSSTQLQVSVPNASISAVVSNPGLPVSVTNPLAGGTTRTTSQTVYLAVTAQGQVSISSFTLQPTTVLGGGRLSATVVLNAPAPTGGATIGFSVPAASASSIVFPQSPVVAAGSTAVTISSIKSNPVSTTESVTVTASSGSSSAPATVTIEKGVGVGAGIQFFSLPYAYADILPNIFMQSTTTGLIAHWNAHTLTYDYQGGGVDAPSAVTIALGLGYWGVFPAGGDNIAYLGAPASASAPSIGNLVEGWNSIGDPYSSPVEVAGLTFGSNNYSFATATSSPVNLISPTLYDYVQSTNSYGPVTSGGQLLPGVGYWIYAFGATTVTYPLPASSGVVISGTTSAGSTSQMGFKKRRHY